MLVGELPLFESMPICEYLDEVTPGSLYPADPLQKARHRGWIEFGNDVLGQLHSLVTVGEEAGFKRARAVLDERWDMLEEILGDGPFFAGTDFGMVDAVYAPIFRFTREIHSRTGLELVTGDTPKVASWAESLLVRPSVRDAVPADFGEEYAAFIRRQHGVMSQRLTH